LIIFLLPISYWLSASITKPINELMNHFEIGIKGDLTIRTKKRSTDEIGLLANYFNSFMDKLENYSRSLQSEMVERSHLEREILEISEKERYHIGQDLHDDLCPHLIGVEALCKVLVMSYIYVRAFRFEGLLLCGQAVKMLGDSPSPTDYLRAACYIRGLPEPFLIIR